MSAVLSPSYVKFYTQDYDPRFKAEEEIQKDFYLITGLLKKIQGNQIVLDECESSLFSRNMEIIYAHFGSYRLEDYDDVFEDTKTLSPFMRRISEAHTYDSLPLHVKILVEAPYVNRKFSLKTLEEHFSILQIIRHNHHLPGNFSLTDQQFKVLMENIKIVGTAIFQYRLKECGSINDIYGVPPTAKDQATEETPTFVNEVEENDNESSSSSGWSFGEEDPIKPILGGFNSPPLTVDVPNPEESTLFFKEGYKSPPIVVRPKLNPGASDCVMDDRRGPLESAIASCHLTASKHFSRSRQGSPPIVCLPPPLPGTLKRTKNNLADLLKASS